ncbi:MFS transporter [Leuconostoc inhae]|uniref:MFS transporter n=1 Tax=Leuconostoc inhae TaxID=178001 RepID=UPI001C7E06B2|nr:MFS transporter [Leuconostoc inhae]
MRSEKKIISNVLKGSLGNLIEWFDWYVYASFAVYFAPSFFPAHDKTAELLSTAAVFAIGFLMRPLGSLVFGKYADQHGRRSALTLSVLIMASGSLIIALTPSYDKIGIFAPTILILARLFQGLSLGGEYGTSATYLSEMASAGHRGFYASFQYVTLISGQLIALGVQIILQTTMTEIALISWGWRIPFFIGAMGALVVLILRLSMEESDQFMAQSKKVKGNLRELLRYPKAILTVVGLTLGGTIAFYTYTTYLQKFMINSVGLPKQQVAWINFLALFIFMILQPLAGALSDKIGRKPLLFWFGGLGTILTIPILTLLSHVKSGWAAFGLMMAGLIIVTGYTSINAIVKAEMFPTEIRALGVGLPYGLTVAIFGGTVEYVALYLKKINHENWFFIYVTLVIAISLVVYWRMTDTKHTSKLDG